MSSKTSIVHAMCTLFGLGGDTWAAWRALIGGACGVPLAPDAAMIFRELTHRQPLTAPCRELWLAIGRRGGKNRVAAAIAVYLALLFKWVLAPGEVGTVMVIARDRLQARVAFRYILGLLQCDPSLQQELDSFTADTITLRNGLEIVIGTADSAAVRGRTIVAVIADEFAHWPQEEAAEVLRALRPGMATQPDAMLIVISTVYAAFGPFYEARRTYFGVDDPHVLYAVATSQQMNPTLSDEFIAAERRRDPIHAAAEYLSIERTNREGMYDGPLVDGSTRVEPRELPRKSVLRYGSGGDISGGRGDATAFAVAHPEGDRVIVDACRRWPAPHDPAVVATEVAEFLKTYGLTTASCDQYGAELSRSIYREAGITLTDSQQSRSDTYLKLLPLLTTGRVELPPDPTLRLELLGLERHTRASGKDLVDHHPGPDSHDDVANAVALAAVAAAGSHCSYTDSILHNVRGPPGDEKFRGSAFDRMRSHYGWSI